MPITLQEIADAAGVSRATVDRALKNRGRVSVEVAEKIKKIADEAGYQPNQAARALALTKNPVKIGVILSSLNTPFMRIVLEGALAAQREVESRGGIVQIRTVYDISVEKIIEYIEEFRAMGVNGIALIPAKDDRIKNIIDELAEKDKIPVITINSDVSESKRICFVGQDNERAGQTVAGLMAECLEPNSPVCVIGGSESNRTMSSRESGFINAIKQLRPDISIFSSYYVRDDNDNVESEAVTLKMLKECLGLKGVYACTPAVTGVCRAIDKWDKAAGLKLITHDVLGKNIDYLKKGTIKFLIGQEGRSQGYEPVMMLYRLFVEEKELALEMEYTSIIIKNRFNL